MKGTKKAAIESIEWLTNKIKSLMANEDNWEECTRYFPEPNLIENKVYPVVVSNDKSINHARFCFGEGEFWWTNTETNKEVRVARFCRI